MKIWKKHIEFFYKYNVLTNNFREVKNNKKIILNTNCYINIKKFFRKKLKKYNKKWKEKIKLEHKRIK